MSAESSPTPAEIARIKAGDPTVAPIGDPLNPAANGELGPSPDNNFGKPTTTLRYDPNWASGNGVRPFNWETTVGILGGEALPIVEVRPRQGGYDYQNKYTSGRTEYFCPASFDGATTQRIQQAALDAFHAVGGRDYGRVDVIAPPGGDPVVLEVNTLPGMTETSLLPKAAAAAGINFPELCQRMVDLAMRRRAHVAAHQ